MFETLLFVLLGVFIPSSQLTAVYGCSVFNVLKNRQALFHGGWMMPWARAALLRGLCAEDPQGVCWG